MYKFFPILTLLTGFVLGVPAKASTTTRAKLPDLVVTSITMSPANPAAGDAITFSAVVKNQGQGATPAGVIIGVAFSVDGVVVSWSDTHTTSLLPGKSITLRANSGPVSVATYTAVAGSHKLSANVNDVKRFAESNFSNNILNTTFTVASLAKPTPTPTPTSTPTTPVPVASQGTPLAQLTVNNTSASSAFTDVYENFVTGGVGTQGMPLTNGDALPLNVSNVSVHKLLPNHPNLKIFVETQDWFCHSASNMQNGKLIPNATCNGALDVGYDSGANAANQVDDMVRRGIDGAAVDWYGPGTTGDIAVSNMISRSMLAYGGKFQVSVDIDNGAFSSPTGSCAGLDPTTTATCFLGYINSKYASSPAFMRLNGKLVIYWFITLEPIDSQIDWPTVKAYANNLGMAMIMDNPWAGFNFYNGNGFSDGAYAWVNPDGSNSGLSYLNTQFFATAQQYPNAMVVGGTWRGFNDVAANWTSNLNIASQCGQTWLNTFSANDAQTIPLSAVMIDTWDDYAEGSEMETGIDNCLSSVNLSVSGTSLKWQDTFGSDPWSGVSGSERTIDHYEIWVSADGGKTANLAAQVAPTGSGTGTVGISSLNIASGNYLAYVRAVGKASIQNHLSAAVAFTR